MSVFRDILDSLREYYRSRPPMPWWPEDPREVIFGAVLVQGSTWKSVDRVLEDLRTKNLLDFRRIVELEESRLIEIVKPVGFQAKKAGRLRALSALFLAETEGDIETFFLREPDRIRRQLLAVDGIGPGTADNILLYAGKVPIFMVDPFTTRFLVRHGFVGKCAKTAEIQELIHSELTPEEEPYGADLFSDFQYYLVRLGRDFCDKTAPRCGECPLNSLLTGGEPIGVENAPTPTSRPDSRDSAQKHGLRPVATTVPPAPPDPPVDLVLDETERRIVDRLGRESVSIDELVVGTGLPVHIVRATIALLETKKILRQVEGNRVRRI